MNLTKCERLSTTEKIPALNGLRAIAAYTVVISHFSSHSGYLEYPLWQSGRLGVMMFFMLSGFLMGHLYFERCLERHNLAAFFSRRVARVAPLYLILVAVSFSLFKWNGTAQPLYSINDSNVVSHLLFVEGVSVLWTIPREIQFYLVFPVFWIVFQRNGDGALILTVAFVVVLAALVKFPSDLLGVIHYFLAGVLASRLKIKSSKYFIEPLFLLSIILVFLSLPKVRASIGYQNAAGWESLLHLSSIFLLLTTSRYSIIADRIFGSAFLAFLGAISYSVYLLHLPLLRMLISMNFLEVMPPYIALALFLVSTTLIAWVSFRLIEVPGQRFVMRVTAEKNTDVFAFHLIGMPIVIILLVGAMPFVSFLWKEDPEACEFEHVNNWIAQPKLHNVSASAGVLVTSGLDPQIIVATPGIKGQAPCLRLSVASPVAETVQIFLPDKNALEDHYSPYRVESYGIKEGEAEATIVLPPYIAGRRIRIDVGNGDVAIAIKSISFGAIP
jgi:peptidoglycan/LPS O-acetylase OafA/YrhL